MNGRALCFSMAFFTGLIHAPLSHGGGVAPDQPPVARDAGMIPEFNENGGFMGAGPYAF